MAAKFYWTASKTDTSTRNRDISVSFDQVHC